MKTKKYTNAFDAIMAMQAREQTASKRTAPISTDAFMDACASGNMAAIRNDPRTKAYDAKVARRESGFYRDGR